MEAELTEHLGYEKHDQSEKPVTNRRNGKTIKELRTGSGPVVIEIPREREGSFESQIVPKHRREFRRFDDKILSMLRIVADEPADRGSSERQVRRICLAGIDKPGNG